MAPIPVGHAIAEALEAEGVTTVFGIPGGHILPLYDGVRARPRLTSILVRHEHAAAAMAAAYAQLTGTPGVVLVTAGPGVTNVVTAVAEAFVGALPMIILAGHNEAPSVYREVIEQRGFGFHHWAIPTRAFDDDIRRYQAAGFEIAYSDVLDTGARIYYVDATGAIGGMVELVDLTPAQLDRYTLFYRSSLAWDGTDPVREG